MKISVISDLHIRSENDKGYLLCVKFLRHPDVVKSDAIYFLGDIFDLMCGPHLEYYEKFPEFFKGIIELLRMKKEVRYFEGNHDVFLAGLFEKVFRKNAVDGSNFSVHRGPFISKTMYFSHGDEFAVKKDWGYVIYKKFLLLKITEILASEVVPYGPVDFLGIKASKYSRKKSKKLDPDFKNKIRNEVVAKAKDKGVNIIVTGHTHVQDSYEEGGISYFNNGHPLETNSFLQLDGRIHKFIKLV